MGCKTITYYLDFEVLKSDSTKKLTSKKSVLKVRNYQEARYYNRELGRYMSVDPHAKNYLNLSSYAYVAGNPITNTDPAGKDIEWGVKGKEKRELKRAVRFERKNNAEFDATFKEWRSESTVHVLRWQQASRQDQIDRGTDQQAKTWNNDISTKGRIQHNFSKQRIQIHSSKTIKVGTLAAGFDGNYSKSFYVSVSSGSIDVKYDMKDVPDQVKVEDSKGVFSLNSGETAGTGTMTTGEMQNYEGSMNVSVAGGSGYGQLSVFKVEIIINDTQGGKTMYTHHRGALRQARKNGFSYDNR